MPSAHRTDDSYRAHLAFISRIARLVCSEGNDLERREAAILLDCGVLRADADAGEADDPLIERVDESSVGPLVFFVDRRGGRKVAYLRDVLLHPEPEMRQIAVAQLRRIAERERVCEQTATAIARMVSAGGLADEVSWRRRGLEIVDAMDDDWLLNLAGVEQCRHPSREELWSQFLHAVLTPSVSGVSKCSARAICPELSGAELEQAQEELLRGESTLDLTCRSYFQRLGHAPFGDERSLSGILLGQEGRGRPDELANAATAWAETTNAPLALYHACEVALTTGIQELTTAQREKVTTWFWDAVLPLDQVASPTRTQIAWALTRQLARYFLHYLEVRLPTVHGQLTASIAWWLASKLSSALLADADQMSSLSEQLESAVGRPAEVVWRLVPPPMSASPFRQLTLHGPSPWAIALLTVLPEVHDLDLLLRGPGPGTEEERLRALRVLAIQCANFPLDEPGYRWNSKARVTLSWVIERGSDDGERAALLAMTSCLDWSTSDVVGDLLRGLGEADAPMQKWSCQTIWQQITGGAQDGERVWEVVTSDEWKAKWWSSIEASSVELLADALLTDTLRRRPEWTAALGHLFVDVAMQRVNEEKDRELLIWVLLRSCLALNASSALVRLLQGDTGPQFRPQVAAASERLECMLPTAGTWAGGRIRALLSELV